MDRLDLWLLAEAVVIVATAGGQGPITIEALFSTWTPFRDRRVRVTRTWADQDDQACKALEWTGPLSDWQGTVTEAANRPFAPPPGWEPGPYERGG